MVAVAMLTVNCSSSSDGSSTSSFYLKCKVNGVSFISSDPFVINSMTKSITGQSDSEMVQETVNLYMPLNVAVGTYTITEEPSNVNSYGGSFHNYDTDRATLNATGTMIVTEVTADVIKGTFSFSSPDADDSMINVTEGTFRAENIQ
ncbi:DUF6252 family protein [Flavobacterium sp.]